MGWSPHSSLWLWAHLGQTSQGYHCGTWRELDSKSVLLEPVLRVILGCSCKFIYGRVSQGNHCSSTWGSLELHTSCTAWNQVYRSLWNAALSSLMEDPVQDVIVAVFGGIKGPDEVQMLPWWHVVIGQQRGGDLLQQPCHVLWVSQKVVASSVGHHRHMKVTNVVCWRCRLQCDNNNI